MSMHSRWRRKYKLFDLDPLEQWHDLPGKNVHTHCQLSLPLITELALVPCFMYTWSSRSRHCMLNIGEFLFDNFCKLANSPAEIHAYLTKFSYYAAFPWPSCMHACTCMHAWRTHWGTNSVVENLPLKMAEEHWEGTWAVEWTCPAGLQAVGAGSMQNHGHIHEHKHQFQDYCTFGKQAQFVQ